ncbi:hypothetical protein L210DRAFT_3535795 [Boletus edulis BED1]|uniref:Protein-S-isoprenylcysteine O-methyltransferase n=1 Tax=Boletus edulis BED1 TaxID=1328754 RepID=A0AAD4BX42_BOLED|nr:hypothetical protein L210DRAFT_3535795 [Boletus edulis BED1]
MVTLVRPISCSACEYQTRLFVAHWHHSSITYTVAVLVVLSTADYFRHTFTGIKQLVVISESRGGRIRPESIPSTFLGRIITPIQDIAIFIPPLVYVGALTLNRFQQPEWIARFAFSTEMIDSTQKNALSVRREKSRVVKTGPYTWVRHPIYSSVLLQEALWCIMFWSYIPLVALGITAAALAIKMPIEESLIQTDDVVGDEYRKYMEEVPARIIPYIW